MKCNHRAKIGDRCTYCAEDEYTGMNDVPVRCGLIGQKRGVCLKVYGHKAHPIFSFNSTSSTNSTQGEREQEASFWAADERSFRDNQRGLNTEFDW